MLELHAAGRSHISLADSPQTHKVSHQDYFKSPLDGLQRLSFYQSSRYPILVLATKAQDDVLASWRQQALVRMARGTGLTLSLARIG